MSQKKNWEKIGDYVLKIDELGMKYVEGAEHFNISVQDIYNYNRRIKKRLCKDKSIDLIRDGENVRAAGGTPDSLEAPPTDDSNQMGADKEKKAKGAILPEELETLIVSYRKEHPDHGYKRIEDYLESRYFVITPRKKIRAVLKAYGLSSRLDSSFDRKEKEAGVVSRPPTRGNCTKWMSPMFIYRTSRYYTWYW